MKKFRVVAYGKKIDDKLEVYQSDSLEQAVSVACALYAASDLNLGVLISEDDLIVSFFSYHSS